MHNTVKNLLDIENNIKINLDKLNIHNYPKIIAVSKTFKIDKILPLIEHGHIDFGENKVQEAIEKWSEIKKKNLDIKLHMIGKLQTNKVKYAIPLFDYIHSLDNLKLAEKISKEQIKHKKDIKIFIQVNIGQESQKSGVQIDDLDKFYEICSMKLGLKIVGLMCLPPSNKNSVLYFKEMEELNKFIGLKKLSMGMSADYLDAIKFGSSHIRIGSKIFGSRN